MRFVILMIFFNDIINATISRMLSQLGVVMLHVVALCLNIDKYLYHWYANKDIFNLSSHILKR